MKDRAICPICGTPVPFHWCLWARPRACPRCLTLIRPDRLWDRISSAIIGTISSMVGLGVAFLAGLWPHVLMIAIVSIVIGAVVGSLIFFSTYRYYMPYVVEKSARGFDVVGAPAPDDRGRGSN